MKQKKRKSADDWDDPNLEEPSKNFERPKRSKRDAGVRRHRAGQRKKEPEQED